MDLSLQHDQEIAASKSGLLNKNETLKEEKSTLTAHNSELLQQAQVDETTLADLK